MWVGKVSQAFINQYNKAGRRLRISPHDEEIGGGWLSHVPLWGGP